MASEVPRVLALFAAGAVASYVIAQIEGAPVTWPSACAHLSHAGRVEPVALGVLQKRGGDAEALLHSLRVGCGTIVRAGAQPHLVEHGVDAILSHPCVAREHAQVVAPGQVWVEGRCLDHRPDARKPLRRAGRDPQDGCLARRGSHEAEQHPQGGRLAGAVRAEEAIHLAAANAQLEVIDGNDRIAVALGERSRLDHETVINHGTATSARRRQSRPAPRSGVRRSGSELSCR
jgi:hypothetical protein